MTFCCEESETPVAVLILLSIPRSEAEGVEEVDILYFCWICAVSEGTPVDITGKRRGIGRLQADMTFLEEVGRSEVRIKFLVD
jgi:hypothetical protein